jgi:hypothetical protein
VVELGQAVRVGADRDRDPALRRAARVRVAEVEPLRRAVDLERFAVALRRREHCVQVHVVRLAAPDPAARGVHEDVDVRMLEGADDAGGHRGALLLEARVHRREDHVELGEDIVRKVHAPVGQDVALRAREDPDLEARLELADQLTLRTQLLHAEAVRDGRGLRVVRHDDVLVAPRLRRRHELVERVPTIRPVGVRVQIAAQIGRGHEARETASTDRFHLAVVLAQLGREPRQADRRVDVFLGRAGDPRSRRLVEHAVLAEPQPLAHRELAHAHVVILAPSEVLQRCAERLRLDDAEVDVQSRLVQDRSARRAFRDDLRRGRQAAEGLHDARGVARGHEDVDVLDCLAAAARRARDLDPVDPAVRAQDLHDLLRDRARHVQWRARAARAPAGDALQDVVARLLAHARHADDAPGATRLLELLDGADPQPLVERAGGLGAEAAHLEQGGEGGRQLAAQGLHVAHGAGRQVLLDPGGQLAADAGQGGQAPTGGDGGHVLGQRLHRLGGPLVGPDPEAALAPGLEERRDLIEKASNFEVFHLYHGTLPAL